MAINMEEQMKMLGLEIEMEEEDLPTPPSPTDDDDDDEDTAQPFIIVKRAAKGALLKVVGRDATATTDTNKTTTRNNNNHVLSTRKLLVLASLSALSLVFLRWINRSMDEIEDVLEDVVMRVGHFHENSFGGKTTKTTLSSVHETLISQVADISTDYSEAPLISNTHGNVNDHSSQRYPHRPQSVNPLNRLNLIGHYWHDERQSPYANSLYSSLSYAAMESEQSSYSQKMSFVRDSYGGWDFRDELNERPIVEDFHVHVGRDVPSETMKEGAWQADGEYVRAFLEEAGRLVERVKEGIYEEYGYGGSESMTTEERRERYDAIKILVKGAKDDDDYDDDKEGVAWINDAGYEFLIRKLLHAMMTNDDFFVVQGGDISSGVGENFYHQTIMQFHHIMEPVFDKLGMNLISRYMPGGTEMLMAGDGITGEKDLFLWQSSDDDDHDDKEESWVWRQTILSGERMPIILSSKGRQQHKNWIMGGLIDTANTAGHNIQFPLTLNETQAMELPYAVRYLNCTKDNNQNLCSSPQHKYISRCWVNRTDVEPDTPQNERPSFDLTSPGFRELRWESRKLALLVLFGLENAIDIWQSETTSQLLLQDTNSTTHKHHPLNDKHWHVSTYQTHLRRKLLKSTPCTFPFLPRLCSSSSHSITLTGVTEYTPRSDPEGQSIRRILKPAPDGSKPHLRYDEQNLYNGPDLLYERVPEGEVDVHAIAIVTMEEGVEQKKKSRRLLLGGGERGRRRLGSASDSQMATTNPTISSNSDDTTMTNNTTTNDENSIIPGTGWTLHGVTGRFCDGSAQSECQRSFQSNCILGNHKGGEGWIVGDATSGWLVMELDGVTHGIVMARMEFLDESSDDDRGMSRAPFVSEDEENPRERRRRQMSKTETMAMTKQTIGHDNNVVVDIPENLQIEIAIDGKISKTFNKSMIESHRDVLGVPLWILMDDKDFAANNKKLQRRKEDGDEVRANEYDDGSSEDEEDDDGRRQQSVEIAIRLLGGAKKVAFAISHVYWA